MPNFDEKSNMRQIGGFFFLMVPLRDHNRKFFSPYNATKYLPESKIVS